MNTTNRLKQFIAARAKALPITDKEGMPVGFADTALFLTDGLRLSARIATANGNETPIKDHVQTLHRQRGASDYAKAYIRTLWEMQPCFFAPTLHHINTKGVEGWGLRGIRTGHVNEDLLNGFDDTLPPKGGNQQQTTPTPAEEA